MALPEIVTRLRSRKKPVRDTATPTVAAISTASAPANLTDVIKKFNANTEDTALALETLKTDLDAKTATTITLSPTAINLPADAVNSVTLQVENLTVLPGGASAFINDYTTIADTDTIAIQKGVDGGLISLADFKATAGLATGSTPTELPFWDDSTVTFYIDTVSGNDTNDGTINSPFLSLAKAKEVAITKQFGARYTLQLVVKGTIDLPLAFWGLKVPTLEIKAENAAERNCTIQSPGYQVPFCFGDGIKKIKLTNCNIKAASTIMMNWHDYDLDVVTYQPMDSALASIGIIFENAKVNMPNGILLDGVYRVTETTWFPRIAFNTCDVTQFNTVVVTNSSLNNFNVFELNGLSRMTYANQVNTGTLHKVRVNPGSILGTGIA